MEDNYSGKHIEMPNNESRSFTGKLLFSDTALEVRTRIMMRRTGRHHVAATITTPATRKKPDKKAKAPDAATEVAVPPPASADPQPAARGFPFLLPDADIIAALRWAYKNRFTEVTKILKNFLIRKEYLPVKNKYADELGFLIGQTWGGIALQVALDAGGDPRAKDDALMKLAFDRHSALAVRALHLAGGNISVITDEDVTKAEREGWLYLARSVRDAKAGKLVQLHDPAPSHRTVALTP